MSAICQEYRQFLEHEDAERREELLGIWLVVVAAIAAEQMRYDDLGRHLVHEAIARLPHKYAYLAKRDADALLKAQHRSYSVSMGGDRRM